MNLYKDQSKLFSKEYYEDGIKNKISGYENFHWIPTRSYSEAIEIINRFDFNSCVDYGCAKGFLVHALRKLGKEAYGEDISDYAIKNCDTKIKDFISKPTNRKIDFIICKDVMEHIPENLVVEIFKYLRNRCKEALFTIPFGDDNVLRIREYEIDITHVTKKDEDWWIDALNESGFKIKEFKYNMGTIKEKWKDYKYGNGFFHVLNLF
jgi:2-polyprenyl-3-methyl-5-hydroxy-6-metoxy-1,4-benzoquinol methylase